MNSFYKVIPREILKKIHRYENDNKRLLYLSLHRFSKFCSKLSLQRVDNRKIPKSNSELRMFLCMRNEELRLPYFLDYHFKLGVDRVFIVDNNSSDRSSEIALQYDKVHLFKTEEPYVAYMNWQDLLLGQYANNSWAMVLDVDEVLLYPKQERYNLSQLCDYLDRKGYNSMRCVLLDMYANSNLSQVHYLPGDNPFEVCPYFDSHYEERKAKSLDRKLWRMYDSEVFVGGVRSRVFKSNSWISKIPIFFNDKKLSACRGMHDLNLAKYADLQGVLLHFKYFSDFLTRIPLEVKRAEHYSNAREYKMYHDVIKLNHDLNLYSKDSVKFESLQQLIELGIMKDSVDL